MTRTWLPGNAQHAANVETLRCLVAIMESLRRIEARQKQDARQPAEHEQGHR